MSDEKSQMLDVVTGHTRSIAVLATPPTPPKNIGLLWLAGLKSNMDSTKATALAAWASACGYGMTRFDYSGHGLSQGRFEDATIGDWLDETSAVFSQVARGPQVVVGSSTGGYLALLLLRRLLTTRPEEADRIRALVLIAPAWDLTEALMWRAFSPEARREILDTGRYLLPSVYGEPYAITRQFIEEGRAHLIAETPFDPGCPVRILHGRQDPDVPFAHSEKLVALLLGQRTTLHAIPDGEHRLSRPSDLAYLFSLVDHAAEGA